MKIINLNEYVKLHDGKKIFYSKYEHIAQACDDIRSKGTDAVLIVGGSDRCIYDHHLEILPKNVKKAFFLNCHIDKSLWGDLVVPIPLGIEVTETIKNNSYSYCQGFEEGIEKKKVLTSPQVKKANKLIYANFRVSTNPGHRTAVKSVALQTKHINWVEPPGATDNERYRGGLPYTSFVEDILDHSAVLCAQGNDMGDNLRIYETLYLSRVAITFNPKMHENLHYMFPTVLIEDLSELQNYELIKDKILKASKNISSTKKYLNFNYWKDLIIKEVK